MEFAPGADLTEDRLLVTAHYATQPSRNADSECGLLFDVIAAVNETFDLAKTRLVEPVHLDDTGYAQLLPATVLSATRQPITISTDLAIANTRWKADHE